MQLLVARDWRVRIEAGEVNGRIASIGRLKVINLGVSGVLHGSGHLPIA